MVAPLGGRTFFNAQAEDLVIGKAQREEARKAAVVAHARAQEELKGIEDQKKSFQALLGMASQSKLPTFDGVTRVFQCLGELRQVAEDLKLLDLSEVESLEAERLTYTHTVASCDEQMARANRKIGEYTQSREQQLIDVEQLGLSIPRCQQRVQDELARLQTLCAANDGLSFLEMEAQTDELLSSGKAPSNLTEATTGQRQKGDEAAADARELVGEYNQHAQHNERLTTLATEQREVGELAKYAVLIRLRDEVRVQLQSQTQSGLYTNLTEVATAEASFQDVFTKQFCYEIRNAVDTGVRTLKALNSELTKLKFGTDKFRIDWAAWVPEFEEYYRFFIAAYDLADSKDSGDLFASEALSPKNCEVRDRLVSLLLSDDQERAQKELQRIADYRNYRRYEIWKESDTGSSVALSEWGTGSGGQLETPAYIIRAAVVTNRLKHFEKGPTLRLLVNDESFSKMDERRAHDVMKFIRDSLGIQLICAMPTKHAGALKSEFTKEWSFTRTEAEGNGEVDFVSEADERDLNPDRLRELWAARRMAVRQQAQLVFDAADV